MGMKVKEVAELVGTSVRTLHYYDEIGLLNPQEITRTGYRLYSHENLERLQQILFFKELGFSLKRIKEIINSPTFDRLEALHIQRKILIEKRDHFGQMIGMIDRTIQHMKGEIKMSNQEKFKGFDFSHNPYEEEARERWGDQAVDQSQAKLNHRSQDKQQMLTEKMNGIYHTLANLRRQSPRSEEAQAAIKEWYDFLNANFGYNYSLETFKGLGRMYVEDERFTKNIDQFGNGLAQFMAEAMAIYADHNQK